MTTTQDTQDFASYVASLPRVLAGAAAPLQDAAGRVLLVEPNYREGWALPGGTIESDDGESPRDGARRETAEEIGLDRPLGGSSRWTGCARRACLRWWRTCTTAGCWARTS